MLSVVYRIFFKLPLFALTTLSIRCGLTECGSIPQCITTFSLSLNLWSISPSSFLSNVSVSCISTNWFRHSRPQRPCCFLSVPRIATSGKVQHRKSAIHGRSLCAYPESSLISLVGSGLNLLCLQSHSEPESHWTYPEVVILGGDQKERGLWGREFDSVNIDIGSLHI